MYGAPRGKLGNPSGAHPVTPTKGSDPERQAQPSVSSCQYQMTKAKDAPRLILFMSLTNNMNNMNNQSTQSWLLKCN